MITVDVVPVGFAVTLESCKLDDAYRLWTGLSGILRAARTGVDYSLVGDDKNNQERDIRRAVELARGL